jgi:hypothetical protein
MKVLYQIVRTTSIRAYYTVSTKSNDTLYKQNTLLICLKKELTKTAVLPYFQISGQGGMY